MTTMKQIEELTNEYAQRREHLAALVKGLHDQIEQLREQFLPRIRVRVAHVADSHAKLTAAIQAAPELFAKPKTQTFAGVRIGYMKQRGKVMIDDEEAAIKRIRAQLPEEQAELLIRTREYVHKHSVYDLTAGDLKRLGITVTDDTDIIVIKPVDGEVDKLVSALLADAERIDAEEAAA